MVTQMSAPRLQEKSKGVTTLEDKSLELESFSSGSLRQMSDIRRPFFISPPQKTESSFFKIS